MAPVDDGLPRSSYWRAAPAPALAEDMPAKYRDVVNKGLDYLAKVQNRDGHWEANGGQYPMAMTAPRRHGHAHGRQHHPRRQVRRPHSPGRGLVHDPQPALTGLLGKPDQTPRKGAATCTAHGFGLLFLSCVYGEEEDSGRRKKLEDILTRAVQFTGKSADDARRLGLTYRRRTAATSMKAPSPSPRSRPSAPPATPASWFPRASSTRPRSI